MSVLSVGLLGTCAALAQQDIVSFTGLGGNQAINGNYTLGYEFSVTSPITVSALSDFASGVASGGTAVGLWNASGTEIASTAVTPSDLLTSDGYFRYSLLSSAITLQDGDYFVGAYAPSGTAYSSGVTGLTAVSGVSYLGSDYSRASGLQDPTTPVSSSLYLFGGNVVLASAVSFGDADPVVPDAGSGMMLLSAGLAGLAAFGRKKLL
jgi:hypothetical protein